MQHPLLFPNSPMWRKISLSSFDKLCGWEWRRLFSRVLLSDGAAVRISVGLVGAWPWVFYSDKISKNSLHDFYKWLCSTDSARNEADAWSQTYCMKLAVSPLLLHVLCSIAVLHTVSFYMLPMQIFTQSFMPLHLQVERWGITTLQICIIHRVILFLFFFLPYPFCACSTNFRSIFRFFLEGREKEQNKQQHCFLHGNVWDLGITDVLYKLNASI